MLMERGGRWREQGGGLGSGLQSRALRRALPVSRGCVGGGIVYVANVLRPRAWITSVDMCLIISCVCVCATRCGARIDPAGLRWGVIDPSVR